MKKILLLTFILLVSITSVYSQLDNKSRAIASLIKQSNVNSQLIENELQNRLMSGADKKQQLTQFYYPVIIKLSQDSSIDELLARGIRIFHKRGNLILASAPIGNIDSISTLSIVESMSLSHPMSINLDSARMMTNINKLHNGVGLPQVYNGEGVVVGISDIGFDPSHIAFQDGRLKKVVYYDSGIDKIEMSTPEKISTWETDAKSNWHATHVAGILAGGYKGNQYYGVAPGADMVITVSRLLENVSILSGVEDVISYAKSMGKPAVVNLSLGSTLGPHDGTSLFNQYLELLGEEAIICLSAGNDGYQKCFLSYDFKKDADEMRTFLYDVPASNGRALIGEVDLWSHDERAFEFAFTVYDRNTKEYVYTTPFMRSKNGEESTWIYTTNEANEHDVLLPYISDVYADIKVYSSVDTENNRYNVYSNITFTNGSNLDESGLLGRYCLGIIVKGNNGMHVDAYSDAGSQGLVFRRIGVDGYLDGNSSRSISDIACGKNVIAVGASNSRNVTPQVDGNIKTYNFNEKEVANFSSYGTLDDGRTLPHFCAPGNMIVAPISTHYTASKDADALSTMAVRETINGKDYYWISECGTSMASPHAAGVIACWLQADTSLTVNDALEIAQSTSNADYLDYPSLKWGTGNIDAYAGLKEVLKRAGVGNVLLNDDNRLLLRPIGYRQFVVEMPQSEIEQVELYSIAGYKVLSHTSSIDARGLNMGVYIIKVKHSKGIAIERILIK